MEYIVNYNEKNKNLFNWIVNLLSFHCARKNQEIKTVTFSIKLATHTLFIYYRTSNTKPLQEYKNKFLHTFLFCRKRMFAPDNKMK